MSNVIEMTSLPHSFSRQTSRGLSAPSTTDFRRLLGEMRLRPPLQRAFLRKFLKRAALTGVPIVFPVQVPVVSP